MKKIVKIIGYGFSLLFLLLVISLGFKMFQWNRASQNNLAQLGEAAQRVTEKGYTFRDLNKNGKLDPYEDARAALEDRVEDLVRQMTIEEKAGAMFITVIGVGQDGNLMERPEFDNLFSFLFPANTELIIQKKMNHFNIMDSPDPDKMILWHNRIQKLAEHSRLGIPITIASDPRHGFAQTVGVSLFTPYFSRWPSAIGLGATRDTALVKTFAEMVRKEYLALGIRLALSPQSDVATEPRWTRIDGTFGEDAALNAQMSAAYIQGIQGDSLGTQSVAAMVKHFPGSGPLDGGKDNHFPPGTQSYRGGMLEYHLAPFEAAFTSNVAAVMPYYSVPKGVTDEDVAAGYNKGIITGMLREKYGFEGLICTDWGIISDATILGMKFKPASAHGVEHLSVDERIIKIVEAGADMIGGEILSEELARLIRSGRISEARIDQSLRRILALKFKLGLFENTYLDPSNSKLFNNPVHRQKGIEAQQKSLVLLKNKGNILPLKSSQKIHFYGFDEDFAEQHAGVPVEEADVILAKLAAPSGRFESEYMMEKMLGGGPLDFSKEELDKMLPLFKSKPTLLVMNLKRPAVIPELVETVTAFIAEFNVENNIILDLVNGKFAPQGKLPFDLPESMEAVEQQLEDVPFDTPHPLFSFGDGLTY